MNLFVYLGLFLKASLFSTGGMGNLPSLHADLMARHWASEREFAESLLIGQLAPGPNGFWVISLGYLTAGLPGAMLALLGITLPPLLVLPVEALYRRVQSHPAVEGFVRGLGLAVVGIFGCVLVNLLSSIGINGRSVIITLAALALGATRRLPLLAILTLAGLAGAVWR
jgi:chromate transporter